MSNDAVTRDAHTQQRNHTQKRRLAYTQFATYEAGKKLVAPLLPPAMHAYSHFVCAAGAFVSCSVVMVPGELLKQRLQVRSVFPTHKG